MYCSKCGVENPENSQQCRSCGQSMTVAIDPRPAHMKETSGYAITALVLGILSPFSCMLTALPAIIFGLIALVKIKQASERLKGNALAIVGLCLPVTLVPIIAILMGTLMPALARTKQLAYRMTCATHLSGLGKAMLIYANDYDDKFPTASNWCDLLMDKAAVPAGFFQCNGAGAGQCHFAINEAVTELGADAPPDMVLLFETQAGWNQVGGLDILTTEHHQDDGCNVLFVDSHVKYVKASEIPRLRWTGDPPE
jgi:prepilin-type processing-associated H-X9-DG protein